jgi:EmrB/QacA subfamily drug resistance transporter
MSISGIMTRRAEWTIFALVAAALFMVVLDVSITNVALPSIQEALHFTSDSALQWVITGYALAFGGFLLLGGRAADLFGRRRTLLIGMSCFSFFSLLIGLSQSALMLIVLRVVQGFSAALMTPSALSIVLTTFAEGPDRNRALGFWTMVSTGGTAVGVLLGGVLTQYLSWRWCFFINVPVGIIIGALILRLVPTHAEENGQRSLDTPGAILVTSGLIAFVYAISQAPVRGWLSGGTLLLVGLALVLLAGFIFNESRTAHPLMPLRIFKIRNVTGANLIMAPLYACGLGGFFITSLYMQTVLCFSPVSTGLSFIPYPIVLGIASFFIPNFVSKYGYKRFLIAGLIFVGLALLWLARLPVDGSYFTNLLPALVLLPLGIGFTFTPLIVAATSGVPRSEAGLASGLITTSQQMGGALGLAILSGVATSVAASAANPHSRDALVHGYTSAFLTAVAFIIFAIILAITVIRQQPPRNREAQTIKGSLEEAR